jgi:hypothetical protein
MTSSPKAHRKATVQKKKRFLRILNINFQSAKKKGKDLEALIDLCDPDVIIGTETWLNGSISSAEVIPSFLGFDVHRRDRPDSHGGVLLAAKQDLQLSDVETASNVELIKGSVRIQGGKKMTVAAYYRPPNRVDDGYLAATKEEVARLKKKSRRGVLLIGGDFNLPEVNWSSQTIQGRQCPSKFNQTFLNIIVDNNLEQQVDFPTTGRCGWILY